MGNSVQFCVGQDTSQVITVYGDYFNPETRMVLTILNLCDIENRLEVIETLPVNDHGEVSAKRESFRK